MWWSSFVVSDRQGDKDWPSSFPCFLSTTVHDLYVDNWWCHIESIHLWWSIACHLEDCCCCVIEKETMQWFLLSCRSRSRSCKVTWSCGDPCTWVWTYNIMFDDFEETRTLAFCVSTTMLPPEIRQTMWSMQKKRRHYLGSHPGCTCSLCRDCSTWNLSTLQGFEITTEWCSVRMWWWSRSVHLWGY